MELPHDPAFPLPGIYPKKPKTLNYKECMCPCVHSRVIYNRQDLEAAQVPISRRVYKTTMGRLHNGILLCHKKEESFTLCGSMDGPGEHYTE